LRRAQHDSLESHHAPWTCLKLSGVSVCSTDFFIHLL
jgi:hypothetical protein